MKNKIFRVKVSHNYIIKTKEGTVLSKIKGSVASYTVVSYDDLDAREISIDMLKKSIEKTNSENFEVNYCEIYFMGTLDNE